MISTSNRKKRNSKQFSSDGLWAYFAINTIFFRSFYQTFCIDQWRMSGRHAGYLIEGLDLPITGLTIDVFQIESQVRQSDTPSVSTYEGASNNAYISAFLFRFAFYLSCTLHPAPYNVHLHRPAVRRLPFPNHRRSITFSYPISFTPCTVNLISSSLSPFALFQNCNCKMPPNSV